MKNEKKNYRFYALLNLFNFAMTGLFFSPNLFETYVFWELVGVVSYLLIGFDYLKKEKSIASKKVFIINRIGDTALISSIVFCAYFMYVYSNNLNLTTLSFTDMNAISTFLYAYTSPAFYLFICSLFIIAALVKSAQFPFYTWLIDAMQAKLPVSALLHSATMVAAGIFLTLRIFPLLIMDDILLKVLISLGCLTAIICSISACAQTNPKKVLAYSTSAQLGLMFLAIGGLNIKAAITLFIAHAFIKSMLFLTLPNENKKFNTISFILFLLGGLTLSGLMFSGMIAKELIYSELSGFVAYVFCAISFLTAFYIIRIALIINYEKGLKFINQIPAITLFLFNIAFYFYIRKSTHYQINEPFWAALTAWICVYILYVKDGFKQIPIIYPLALNGFYLDKFYTTIIVNGFNEFTQKLNIMEKKIFSNYNPITSLTTFGIKISNFIETHIMNGSVNLLTKSAKTLSLLNSKAQNGNIQRYNEFAFIIITAILACLIIGYTAAIGVSRYGL
jgi:NADH-quinone oxidoreductase subunit L